MKAALAPFALLIPGAAFLAAQEPQRPPTFKSGVQLIEVDARVFDKDGRFVRDLTKEDFEVLENGALQRIDAAYMVEGPARPGDAARPAATSPAAAGDDPAAPIAPQTWIFYFDINHLTPGGGFDRARQAVEGFIRDRLKDGDLGGILAGDRMVGNRLTSVRQELLDNLKQVKPNSEARNRTTEMTREWPRFLDEEEVARVARNERESLVRVLDRACSDDPDACRMTSPEMMVMTKARRLQQTMQSAAMLTMNTIERMATGLARIPGPKTVVLLSDGFVTEQVETTLRSVIGQAGSAGARIYAIDVRGLNRFGNAGIIDKARVEDSYGPVTKFDNIADGPNSLAVDTGGLMIRNENNIGRALDTIAEDAGTYYVLAYQPADARFDGKFRPIEVRVKRDGLRVRARKGYLALDPARMTKPQPIKSTPAAAAATAPAPPFAPPSAPEWPRPVPALPGVPPPPPSPPATGVRTGGAAEGEPSAGSVRLRPDAETRVKELSEADTSAASKLGAEGWAAYQRGDLEAAIGPLTSAAVLPDVRPWVLYALGFAQTGLGRATEALASWERVREAAPDFKPVYIDLASTHASLADLTKALAVLRDAEQRFPKDAEVHNAIGVIHFRRGALDEAIAAFTRATVAAPADSLAFLNLGRAYELRFTRSGRYVTSQLRWVMDEGDRQKATDAYQAYLRLGGPFVDAAREGLQRLEWSK